MSSLNSPSTDKVGNQDDMDEEEYSPGHPPQPGLAELDPPLLQIIDEDSLDIVLNPLNGEAMMSGVSRRSAHKRLQVLGQDLIKYTVLRFLWEKYPVDSGRALQTRRDIFCRPHQLAVFAKLYKLTTEWPDDEYDGNDVEKTYASIFEAYVGAATLEFSMDQVHKWVYGICKSYGDESNVTDVPEAAPPTPAPLPTHAAHPPLFNNSGRPPTALMQMGYNFHQPYNAYGHMPQPNHPPPALPGQNQVQIKQEPEEYHPSMPLLPPSQPYPQPHQMQYPQPSQMPYHAQPALHQAPILQAVAPKGSSGYLGALRQKATQLRKEVSFTESSSGPDHQKQWTCALLVDHVEVGVGTANAKQIAKDMAAQQALVRLGWI